MWLLLQTDVTSVNFCKLLFQALYMINVSKNPSCKGLVKSLICDDYYTELHFTSGFSLFVMQRHFTSGSAFSKCMLKVWNWKILVTPFVHWNSASVGFGKSQVSEQTKFQKPRFAFRGHPLLNFWACTINLQLLYVPDLQIHCLKIKPYFLKRSLFSALMKTIDIWNMISFPCFNRVGNKWQSDLHTIWCPCLKLRNPTERHKVVAV